MTKMFSRVAMGAPQLKDLLRELVATDVDIPHQKIAERLGRFIDFSGSITLSEAQAVRAKKKTAPASCSNRVANDAYLRVRAVIMRNIINTCRPKPIEDEELPLDDHIIELTNKGVNFDAYRAFYIGHQAFMSAKIQSLHRDVRHLAEEVSPKLAKLVALDVALGDATVTRTRQILKAIPALLAKRFEHVRDACQTHGTVDAWLEPGMGFDQFSQEIMILLLAEMDFRLQPVLGLVETINSEHLIQNA